MFSLDIVDLEGIGRDAVSNQGFFIFGHCGMAAWFQQKLRAIRLAFAGHGQPAIVSKRDIFLWLEAEDLGVEFQRLVLIIDENLCYMDFYGRSLKLEIQPSCN